MRLLFERILLEKNEDKKAIERLSDLLGEEDASKIINDLFKGPNGNDPKIHAFNHSKGWLQKYILGIERLIRDAAQGDKRKAIEFIENEDVLETLNAYLTWVKTNRPKLGDNPENPSKQQLALDDEFMNSISFEELQDKVDSILDSGEDEETDERVPLSNDQWEVVPIDSFNQMNSMFGGHWTGDGTTNTAAGRGGNAWCHTNADDVYSGWTSNGKKFFVVMNKNFKDIPFKHLANVTKPEDLQDEYGTSLMAVQVDKKGNALQCTMRRNHVDTPSRWADEGFGEASEIFDGVQRITGLNLRQIVKQTMGIKPIKIRNGAITYSGGIVKEMDGFDDNRDPKRIIRVVINDGVTSISSGAFEGLVALKEVVVPNSITTIGDRAFIGCLAIESINIPDSVTTIGNEAFLSCRALRSISLPDSVAKIGNSVFKDCSALESVKLSNSLIELPPSTFGGCRSLRNVEFGEAINHIYTNAFSGCKDLILNLPDATTIVDKTAFEGCENVVINTSSPKVFKSLSHKIENDVRAFGSCGFKVNYTAMEEGNDIEHVVYRGEKMSIQFGDDKISEIKYVTIPKGTSTIETGAFSGCVNLLGFTDQSDFSDINSIDDYAFENCERLVAIDLHQMQNLWWIGEGAFKNCKSLTYVELPDTSEAPQKIPNSCFEGCTSLQKVDCNDTIRVIGNQAFKDSGVLTVGGLGKLTTIGKSAFDGCQNLRALALTNPRVRDIAADAFNNCSSLEGIKCTNEYVERYCSSHNIPCVRD